MNMSGVLDTINKPNAEPEDYPGKDGLLYCGKCHTPKQMHGTGFAANKILSITCECQTKKLETEKVESERKIIEELREQCIPTEATRGHIFSKADDSSEKHIRNAKKYVDHWREVRQRNAGLVFWGNTGSGKSYVSHCIANALIDKGIPVRLFTAEELAVLLTDYSKRAGTIKSIHEAPLMIIDDFGAEDDKGGSHSKICEAIDARIESGKPLIVTTNYTIGEMRDNQDRGLQRIFDRLLSVCVPVAVVGESRRRGIGEENKRFIQDLFEAPENNST